MNQLAKFFDSQSYVLCRRRDIISASLNLFHNVSGRKATVLTVGGMPLTL